MSIHKNAVLGDAHFAHTWEYANTAAPRGYRFYLYGRQQARAPTRYRRAYILTAATPTWVAVGVTEALFLSRIQRRYGRAAIRFFIGQGGYETDSTKFKIGDGVTAWNSLAHWRYVPEHK